MIPLLFPPHVIAVASIYLAARLDSVDGAGGTPAADGQRSSQEVSEFLGNRGSWEQKYRTEVQDLEGDKCLLSGLSGN
jgi:CTD kinase subunit beta